MEAWDEIVREDALRAVRYAGGSSLREVELAIQALWSDADDAATMREILLPRCVARSAPGDLVVWCAGEIDQEKPGFYETVCGHTGPRGSVYMRRWPTCPDCRALLLECREWMPEWWAVEEMTEEEARHVLDASAGPGPVFSEGVCETAFQRMRRAAEDEWAAQNLMGTETLPVSTNGKE